MNLRLLGGNELDLSGGRLNFVSGPDETRQAIQTALSLVKGEWFLDTDAGVPLFERILVKGPNLALVKSVIRKTVLAVPRVTGVPVLEVTFNRAARSLAVQFTATSDAGTVSGPATVGP